MNSVTSNHLDFFQSTGARLQHHSLSRHNQDVFRHYQGSAQHTIFPQTARQVSQILRYCHRRHLGVVAQGGNTGTAGGALAASTEVLLCMTDMNRVRELDEISGTLVAESGCILNDLDQLAQQHGYIMPVDLGSKRQCTIGGNVSTSAGGLRFLRYGSLHGNVLGLEVVLPDGQIIDGLFKLRKDVSGYDIKQLFVGAEGTLGVVTAVSLALAPKPLSTHLCVLGLDSFERVQQAFVKARQHLGEIVSAYEFWERRCTQLVLEYIDGSESPLASDHPFYVLVETRGSNREHDKEKMSLFVEKLDNLVDEFRIYEAEEETRRVWEFRERMAEAHGKRGSMYIYDLSLPSKYQGHLQPAVKQHLAQLGLFYPGQPSRDALVRDVTVFGHIGDDNIHLQVIASKFCPEVQTAMEPWVYQWVGQHQGSVAAEHGLGKDKGKFLKYSKPPPLIDLMKSIKRLVDPHGIMNPGKHINQCM